MHIYLYIRIHYQAKLEAALYMIRLQKLMTSPETSPIWTVSKGMALPQGACTLKSDTVVRVR